MQAKSNYRLPIRKNGQRTFKRIIDVSKELFALNGFMATSINEIIKEAKIATGTFYQYFDDKRAVYDYLLNDYSIRIRKNINEAIQGYNKRYDQEKYGIQAFLKFALEDKLSYRIIWESMFVDPTLFKNYYTNFAKGYIKQLNSAVSNNEVDNKVDLETLSYVLMGISNFVGLQVVFKDEITDEELEYITNNVMYILKHGMFKK